MGMTPERQAEMQRSLMAMLGDRRQLDQPVTVPKTSRSIKLSADVPPPIAPDAVILPPSPPDGAGMSSSLLSSMSAHENGNFDKLSNSNHFVSENELNNWVCALCTLANHNFSEYCEACDTARP